MLIFYRKHYQATTPFWLHGLIIGGIVLKGGVGLLRETLAAPAAVPVGGKR
jgi:hypothetical protein